MQCRVDAYAARSGRNLASVRIAPPKLFRHDLATRFAGEGFGGDDPNFIALRSLAVLTVLSKDKFYARLVPSSLVAGDRR